MNPGTKIPAYGPFFPVSASISRTLLVSLRCNAALAPQAMLAHLAPGLRSEQTATHLPTCRGNSIMILTDLQGGSGLDGEDR